jgi:multiple antibiotic resistance protein
MMVAPLLITGRLIARRLVLRRLRERGAGGARQHGEEEGPDRDSVQCAHLQSPVDPAGLRRPAERLYVGSTGALPPLHCLNNSPRTLYHRNGRCRLRVMFASSIFAAVLHFGSIIGLALGALLPIVDPLGGAPIYLAMTTGLTTDQRTRMAKLVAINSFVLLIASTLAGAYVLDFFGLSIPAVQVAGGIVVCLVGWQLLNSPNTQPAVDRSSTPAPSSEDLSQQAFYPMTMPLTVGPGSISVALTLGANPPPGFRPLLVTVVAHTIGILLVALGVYLCYRYAEVILRKLGPTGTGVVVRLTAFILLCIGVQICWNGVHALLLSTFPGLN